MLKIVVHIWIVLSANYRLAARTERVSTYKDAATIHGLKVDYTRDFYSSLLSLCHAQSVSLEHGIRSLIRHST